jgi:hypothetical protein
MLISSSVNVFNRWRHCNFFPLSGLCYAVIALEISWLAGFRIAESDIWFHLRNASQLLTARSFLHADLYTFTSLGAPLLNHEWLSELPYYLAFQLDGLRGLLAVYTVALWLIFGGVYYLALKRGANCSNAALVTMAGVVLGCDSFGPRMFQFGWLCLVVLLIVLEYFRRTGKGLWVLPPLFALWINLHGSWTFGLVIIGIYIVCGLAEGQWGNVQADYWTPAQLRKLVATLGASIIALLANPYGYKLMWYPFDLLSRQRANIENVIEWKSVNFHDGWGKLALLTIFALLAAALLSRKRWKLSDIALIVFALWVSLTHVRFLIFFAIILPPILAPHVQLFGPHDEKKDKPWLNVAMAAVIAGIILWIYPSATQLAHNIDTQFPRDALRFMQKKQISGRLFNYYDFGGYIEWNVPAMKTFADGRTDIFVYNGVFEDNLKIVGVERPLELLDKYRIDIVLFPVDTPLCYVLEHSAKWRIIYEDKVVKLYAKAP